MERNFTHNWMDKNNDLFQLIISDEINHMFDGAPTENTVIEKVEKSNTESLYLLKGKPIMKIVHDVSKAKETIYVKDRRRTNRRSKTTSPAISLPVARIKTGPI